MTLPYERRRALDAAYDFLCDLRDPKKTPRVPRTVRRQACHVLRHHPGTLFDLYYCEKKQC
jgi:hypothetical protein